MSGADAKSIKEDISRATNYARRFMAVAALNALGPLQALQARAAGGVQ